MQTEPAAATPLSTVEKQPFLGSALLCFPYRTEGNDSFHLQMVCEFVGLYGALFAFSVCVSVCLRVGSSGRNQPQEDVQARSSAIAVETWTGEREGEREKKKL